MQKIMKKHIALSLITAGFGLLTLAGANAWSVATNVPATAITSVPFVITVSGNYYLPTNLTDGVPGTPAIVIEASQVTLDLNGRTLSGAGPSAVQTGVEVLGQVDVIVQQGDIDNFHIGVFWVPSAATPLKNAKNLVENVRFNNNVIGVYSESGTSNWVKQCVIDGGDVGVLLNDDIGSRVSHSIFEEQQKTQAVGMGTAIVTMPSRGTLADENLIAKATSPGAGTFGLIGSSVDKLRFDTFVNYPIMFPFVGAMDVGAVSEN